MIYIRADSNSTISGGHIMRCLAIANALIEERKEVTFLIADENPKPVLEEAGISYVNLHSDWQDLMTDVDQVKSILSSSINPTILIDTYKITKEYVEILKPVGRVGYLGSKPEYLGRLDFLINYSTDIDYHFYETNYKDGTKLLLGAAYAPLRKEFQNINPKYRAQLRRILLTTGNTDNDGLVADILNGIINTLDPTGIVVDVVVGRMFKNKEELHHDFDLNPNIDLHENVTSMSSLMKQCDLAISANGTTVYELSAIGLPIISFAMVEEQVRSAETLGKLNVVDYCGKSYKNKGTCIGKIIDRVRYYIENDAERIALAKRAHALIDGNGCKKIADVFKGLR